MIRFILLVIIIASFLAIVSGLIAAAPGSPLPDPADKRDRKLEHASNKITCKSKPTKTADTPAAWSTDKEFKLMFSNNIKAKAKKAKKTNE